MRRIARSVMGLMALLGAVVAGDARAQVCTNTPLPEVSAAVIPANGFPLYYDDANGLALQPCLDPAGCGALAASLPNPLAPISFPANFPVETFYARAVAKFTAGAVSGLYTAALEGSFLNGVVAAGNQMVFARVRVRVAGLQPGGVYTATHPYGVKTLTADVFGAINDTVDVGVVPLQFQLALAGPIGPTFLTWDTAPPAGFIGDAATPHTVTGSPCGTNFFKVEGPRLPAGGVQTPLFVVTGKKIDVCGNGVLDIGEQCDDGNKLAGDCCSPTCTFEPLGSPCTDGNPCTDNACNGAGVCVATPNMAVCNDGNACTTADVCTAGTCVGGPALNCNDGNVCTTDTCDPALGCVHTPNSLPCDDGNACTTADVCAAGVCVGGPALNCNDGNVCTTDTCDPALGCVHTPIPGCTICTPTTCAAQGKNCGTIPDGCGGTLTCGVCAAPQTCGGAGVANVCGVPPACTPTTCAAQGKNCGTIPDGCGGTLTCGVCTAPQTCGGAAVANVCAVPLPPATLTLTASGRAGETISSTPAGLSVLVGTTRSAIFPGGTRITLRDTRGRSVIWSGVCSSAGNKTPSCTFTLTANASETGNVQ